MGLDTKLLIFEPSHGHSYRNITSFPKLYLNLTRRDSSLTNYHYIDGGSFFHYPSAVSYRERILPSANTVKTQDQLVLKRKNTSEEEHNITPYCCITSISTAACWTGAALM